MITKTQPSLKHLMAMETIEYHEGHHIAHGPRLDQKLDDPLG